jgi:hypothetical protein
VAERERFFGTCLRLADRSVGPAAAEAPRMLPLPLEGGFAQPVPAAPAIKPSFAAEGELFWRAARGGRGGE